MGKEVKETEEGPPWNECLFYDTGETSRCRCCLCRHAYDVCQAWPWYGPVAWTTPEVLANH